MQAALLSVSGPVAPRVAAAPRRAARASVPRVVAQASQREAGSITADEKFVCPALKVKCNRFDGMFLWHIS